MYVYICMFLSLYMENVLSRVPSGFPVFRAFSVSRSVPLSRKIFLHCEIYTSRDRIKCIIYTHRSIFFIYCDERYKKFALT